jgi:hypothetical protein
MFFGRADSERRRHWLGTWPAQILICMILGTIFVVAVPPINVLVLVGWVIVLVAGTKKRRESISERDRSIGRSLDRNRLPTPLLSIILMVGIVTAAYLAPVKTLDRVLERQVNLPTAEMTLGELRDHADLDIHESFPVRLSISVHESEDSLLIRFPSQKLSLRQFLSVVESQSPLRHRFVCCGNGYTVLWGEYGGSHLNLRNPKAHYT